VIVVADEHVDPNSEKTAQSKSLRPRPNDFEIGLRHQLPCRDARYQGRIIDTGTNSTLTVRARSSPRRWPRGRIVEEKLRTCTFGLPSAAVKSSSCGCRSMVGQGRVMAKAAGDRSATATPDHRQPGTRWSRVETCTMVHLASAVWGIDPHLARPGGETVCWTDRPGGWEQDPSARHLFSSALWPSHHGWPDTPGNWRSSSDRVLVTATTSCSSVAR